jgi:hypothetical protein
MNNQRLIIRVSQGSLSFSTTDAGQVYFERYPLNSSISIAANMREALRTMPMLENDYGRVVVLADSPILLVPIDLYNESSQETEYFHTFSRQEGVVVVSHVLPNLNAVALFSIHRDLRQVLTGRFANLLVLPVMGSIWLHMYQKSFTGQRQKLYAYFHDRRLELFSFQQNRFKFYNAYPIGTNPNDALFYLLSVWKQVGLEPGEDELHMSGDLPSREQLIDDVRRYIKRVFIANPSGEFNRAPVTQIEGMPYDLMTYYMKRG